MAAPVTEEQRLRDALARIERLEGALREWMDAKRAYSARFEPAGDPMLATSRYAEANIDLENLASAIITPQPAQEPARGLSDFCADCERLGSLGPCRDHGEPELPLPQPTTALGWLDLIAAMDAEKSPTLCNVIGDMREWRKGHGDDVQRDAERWRACVARQMFPEFGTCEGGQWRWYMPTFPNPVPQCYDTPEQAVDAARAEQGERT